MGQPQADAGADVTVPAGPGGRGARVTLRGSGVDPAGGALSFSWRGPCGASLFVIDTRRLRANTIYGFRITLTDGSTIPFRVTVR